MTDIKITKKDVIWSYLAQFFNLGVGFITLPVILKMLDADEVGLNYILVSINSVIVLFDMGFSAQFGKNITYVLSGAQSIEKEGISSLYENSINEKLLACLLATAKTIYKSISLLALIPLLTIGTYYIWKVTNNGASINNLLLIWIIFCVSCFFNLYFLYYNSFLQGRGLVKEAKQGQILSRITQIAVMFSMLFCGCGLLSVVVANLIAPFSFRFFANKKFFDSYIKTVIKTYPIASEDMKYTFKILLFNAKKMGVIGVLASALVYASTLIVGAFLPLSEVGSYGLMIQLLGIIGGVSTLFFYSLTPELSKCIVKKQFSTLRERFGFSIFSFIAIQLIGLGAMMIAPICFRLLGFETQLPSYLIILLFYIYRFIELNQSLYCQLLLLENNLIFYKSAIWSCIIGVILLLLFLYLGWGFYGIFLAQMLPLCAYTAWKWPIYSSKR
ncbi:MAG: oligosaccharide flippase family protein, partial [Bacilli bacterium]|nr:oligosaccharide flippase family protein [Bacilli bacterium]